MLTLLRPATLLPLALLLSCAIASAIGEQPRVIGENLVVNGGFEAGGEGWSPAPEIVTEGAHEGARYGAVDNLAEAGADKVIIQDFVPLKPNTYYEFRMAARRETGEGYFYVHLNWFAEPGRRLMSTPQWHAGRVEPVTLRTGEGTGDWQEYSAVFRSTRADMGGVQVVMFIRGGSDRVSLDDTSIRELAYPEAPQWALPDAVVFEGHPSRFGMAVEDVRQDGQRFTITTTGAQYALNAAEGTMECRQRIGVERDVVSADFDGSLGRMRIAYQDDEVCVLQGPRLAIGFQGDSLVTIATNRPLSATLTSAIGAEWFRTAEPHLLAIDEHGGWCVTPWARPKLASPGTTMTPPERSTGRPGWSARWEIGAREMFALAVFPGREFRWEDSFEDRIFCTTVTQQANHQVPDEALREYAKYASVHMLFNGIYDHVTGSEPYMAPYNIGDPDRLRAMIGLGHELGMETVLYRAPTTYEPIGLSLTSFVEDLYADRNWYGFDGWYFDGYLEDWMDCYRAMRVIRDQVGDGTIYVHCTLNPPVRMSELYCPFIDSYASFLLRAEAQFIDGPADPYLRYVVNTQNISNSIATLKGNEMRAARGSEEHASLKLQLQTMLSLNGRCRWAYPGWPLNETDLNDYIGYYFAELDRMEAQWRATGEPIPMTWPPRVEE